MEGTPTLTRVIIFTIFILLRNISVFALLMIMPRTLSRAMLITIFIIALIILILIPDKFGFLLFASFELCAYYLAYRRRISGLLVLFIGAIIEAYNMVQLQFPQP